MVKSVTTAMSLPKIKIEQECKYIQFIHHVFKLQHIAIYSSPQHILIYNDCNIYAITVKAKIAPITTYTYNNCNICAITVLNDTDSTPMILGPYRAVNREPGKYC